MSNLNFWTTSRSGLASKKRYGDNFRQIESNFNERYGATQRNPATTRIQRNPATTGIQRNPEHRRRHFRNCIEFLASDPGIAWIFNEANFPQSLRSTPAKVPLELLRIIPVSSPGPAWVVSENEINDSVKIPIINNTSEVTPIYLCFNSFWEI